MRSFLLVLACAWPALCRASCWDEAGQQYGIDASLLKAIAWKESRGWPKAIGPRLPDGNHALGLMQINTIHLPTLAKFGIQREHLFDACVSQKVGAWVLAECIHRFGETWKAVGCYYAGPASKNTAAQVDYVLDVQRFYAGYKRQERHGDAAGSVSTSHVQPHKHSIAAMAPLSKTPFAPAPLHASSTITRLAVGTPIPVVATGSFSASDADTAIAFASLAIATQE